MGYLDVYKCLTAPRPHDCLTQAMAATPTTKTDAQNVDSYTHSKPRYKVKQETLTETAAIGGTFFGLLWVLLVRGAPVLPISTNPRKNYDDMVI